MGDGYALRAFSRAVLRDDEQLAEAGLHDLYVLIYPEGGLEVVATEHGELLLWGYSDVPNVVDACGNGQPYVPVTLAEFTAFAKSQDTTVLVALDVWHPEGRRYEAPSYGELEPLEELRLEPAEPGLVWIPTRPVRAGDREAYAELHCVTPGQPLLLVYGSLDELQANCGPHQAAAAIYADRVDEVAYQAGASGVAFGAVLPDEARHRAPVRDWARQSNLRHLS